MSCLGSKQYLMIVFLLPSGGPLGELVQWSDIISALYILGHDLTITSEVEELAAYAFRIVDVSFMLRFSL